MATRPASAPNLETLALNCLVLGSDGVICWGNTASQAIGWAPRGDLRHLTEVVHPDDRTLAQDLLDETAACGHAERTISTIGSENGALVYLHCILGRATEGADVGGDMFLQGWDVTKWVVREQELELQAHRDPLTGAANRLAFMARLDQELSLTRLPSSDVAVFYADVDDFKRVNDVYGHEAGDRVLVELAARLQASLRPADLLGRLGGDEFAMICPDLLGWPAAVALIERLRYVAAEPINSRDGEIRVSLSLGAAFADPRDDPQERAAALLARADERMFQQKPGRRGDAVTSPRMSGGFR